MMLPLLPFFACFVTLADAVKLTSVPADARVSSTLDRRGHWWAQVGDRVFYAPPASFLEMNHNSSDYYYVMGSKSALSPEMKEHVVGSQGRWHIMHLPKGPSMLQVSAQSYSGDRRSSVSALNQLKSGTVLAAHFPRYEITTAYRHPLDAKGQMLEKKAVASVKEDSAMDYLKKLVGKFPTRSYSNPDASAKVEKFLKNEFEALGLHTCYHTFDASMTSLTNVVAHIPGTEPGAVIVGAHYDSRPFTGAAPGAEDNGSGSASLLAIASAFMKSKAVPKKSVYFVGFAGEEPGLIGSKHFADALKTSSLPDECSAPSSLMENSLQKSQSGQTLKGKKFDKVFRASDYSSIIMDEIGWKSPNPGFEKSTVNLESYDAQGQEVMDHLKASAQMHNGDKLDVVHNGNPFGSDHMSFLNNGIASALTINGDDEAYPHYHQSSDTIENVDPGLMMMITKMNLGALMRIAM